MCNSPSSTLVADSHRYIENQFFSTSCEVEGTSITNKIGDALVSRIIQAHHSGQEWRAVIVIPLVPGYTFPIDHESAGSVRCIMECQARSIAQGENSIFARLRREGINPDDYITFYSLRGWGKFKSGALTTEAVGSFLSEIEVELIEGRCTFTPRLSSRTTGS